MGRDRTAGSASNTVYSMQPNNRATWTIELYTIYIFCTKELHLIYPANTLTKYFRSVKSGPPLITVS